jgi:hypothetical protein
MEIKDLEKLEYDVSGLTARKITDKYVREHFDIEKMKEDIFKESKKEQIMNPSTFFYGNEFPIRIFISAIEQKLKEFDTIRTINTESGPKYVVSKITKEEYSEKEIIDGIKKRLKDLVKAEKDG